MATTPPTKANALQLLSAYEDAAFRIALRRGASGEWMVHTLVIDAIPKRYTQDADTLADRYSLGKFRYWADDASFIGDIESTSAILDWFRGKEVTLSLMGGPGTASRVIRGMLPDLHDNVQHNQFYSQASAGDGLDRMRWPHEMYVFHPTQQRSDPEDTRPLVLKSPSGSRPFKSFKMALIELIYGVRDRDVASRHSASPFYALRLVKEDPFLENVRQVNARTVAMSVFGRVRVGTAIHLSASGGLELAKDVQTPGSYELSLEEDVTRQGAIVLMQQDEIVDEYEWDVRYAPLPQQNAAVLASVLPDEYAPLFDVDPVANLTGLGFAQPALTPTSAPPSEHVPDGIQESLARFKAEHPEAQKTGFIMMRFEKTSAHRQIAKAVKEVAAEHGLMALRADDKWYHSDLYLNVLTYMHGCGFGIAVFERLETDAFNPNVALEVGYMLALQKPVCLLKDQTVTSLHADLVGKLYKPFDPQGIKKSISEELTSWLRDWILPPS